MTSPSVLSVLSPSDALAAGTEQLGGKALQLARLSAAGFPVPDWRCIAAATARSIVERPTVASALEAARSAVDDNGDLVAGATLPSETFRLALSEELAGDATLRAQLTALLDTLGGPVAVRSSAIAEDGAAHSFAGQFETILGVRTHDDYIDAVCRCWASALSDRVIAYRVRNRLDPFDTAMAVVVQRMVAADVAGVMFGADPTTGDPDTIVIGATWGLGEALVSGIANADTYRVRADGTI
jgi:pyruvate,water dikinase